MKSGRKNCGDAEGCNRRLPVGRSLRIVRAANQALDEVRYPRPADQHRPPGRKEDPLHWIRAYPSAAPSSPKSAAPIASAASRCMVGVTWL